MKVILAEKPSVARDIAKVLGVQQRKDGYLEGNGYRVTWAFGHLGELAPAKAYVENPWDIGALPVIPDPFQFVLKDDPGAKKQFKVIKDLFLACNEIIVATDAGREGEHIFRVIYALSGCRKPFWRLWISSLTDQAIREGFEKLKDGSDFDRLASAAESRQKADWLVGVNATIAMTKKAGQGGDVLSLGRVQTPTLALICNRYLEYEHFRPKAYFVPQLELEKAGVRFKATYASDKLFDKEIAGSVISVVKDTILCSKSEKKEKKEPQPLLYDLTSFQSEANKKYGFSASKTLKILQALYEKHKALTYPRTDSRYLSEDIFETLPELIGQLKGMEPYDGLLGQLDVDDLPKRSVNNSKVSDHHAIIPTGVLPKDLSDDESKVFDMAVRRFVAAFHLPCIKSVVTYHFGEQEHVFRSSGSTILQMGWRNAEQVLGSGDKGDKEEENQQLPAVAAQETLSVSSKKVLEKQTQPPPIHTESSLLKTMETAGKEVEDPELREALKDGGIGTPATRASIIELVIKRGYVERKAKKLIPTAKGLSLYEQIKEKKIASPELTGEWEKQLSLMEKGRVPAKDFMQNIVGYTQKIVGEIAESDMVVKSDNFGTCPKCGKGVVLSFSKLYGCSEWKSGCDFKIFRSIARKKISSSTVKELLSKKQTGKIKGFTSKRGKSFDAKLVLKDNTVEFSFD